MAEPKTSSNKIIILIVVLVVAVILAVLVAKSQRTVAPGAANNNVNNSTYAQQQKNLAALDLIFTSGQVVSASADKIEFNVGPKLISSTAHISSQTQIFKLGADGKDQTAALSDIKPKTNIIVYYTSPPKDQVYEAYKILITK